MDPSPILETIYLHMSIIQTYRLGLGNKSVFDSSFVSLFSEEMKSNGNQVGKKITFLGSTQHSTIFLQQRRNIIIYSSKIAFNQKGVPITWVNKCLF